MICCIKSLILLPNLAFSVLRFDNLVGVPGQFLVQSIGSRDGIDAYPVLGRLVVRITDTIIQHLQVLDALRLTFQ